MEKAQTADAFQKSQQNNLMNRLYLSDGEKDFAYRKLTKQWISFEELGVKEVERAIILPCREYAGGVSSENFEFIAGHLERKPTQGGNVSSLPLVSKSYAVPREEVEFKDETVVFGGIMQDHPGHQMFEGIANRMWWHIKNPNSNLRFAFVEIWGDGKARFPKEFLELLGVSEERILFITKPTQFARVLIPDQAIYCFDSFQKREYMSVINRIKNNVEIGPSKKYFLRKNSKNDIVNQEYFAQFYAKKGFEIIDPENYSLREKVSMMRGAKEIAAIGGTNLMYAVFCEPETKVFLLGRANDPIAEQYVPYHMADIKDMYVIDVSLNFLHRDRVWGVNLLGATKYWAQFVQDYYHEQIEETKESVLKEFSYEYLKRCAEYYSISNFTFSKFKGTSHFQILDLMNRVLLGREIDPSKFDTREIDVKSIAMYENNINDLQQQLGRCHNAINFYTELSVDYLGEQRFGRFLRSFAGKTAAVLKAQDFWAFFLKACENADVNIVFTSQKHALDALTAEELAECRKADVVITCCVHGTKTHERDGVKCIDIWDILRDDSLTKDLPAATAGDLSSETLAAIAHEARRAKEICENIEKMATGEEEEKA